MRDDYWDIGVDFRKYMPEEYCGVVYHYTSTASLFNILSDNGISLWISRHDCLNDISEGSVASEVYKIVLEQLKEKNNITDEQYNFLKNVKLDDKMSFLYHSKNLKVGLRKETYVHSALFVCCFSKDEDSLPMWNYYAKGNHYEGYSIGFSSKKFQQELEKKKDDPNNSWSNVEFDIFPVVYSKNEQIKYVYNFMLEFIELVNTEIIDIDYSSTYISDALREWNTVFKNECFAHENEVRLIIRRPLDIVSDAVCCELPKLCYRHNREYLIPYICLCIPHDILQDICFGPSIIDKENKNRQVQILKDSLLDKGYNDFQIKYSNIPVRY